MLSDLNASSSPHYSPTAVGCAASLLLLLAAPQFVGWFADGRVVRDAVTIGIPHRKLTRT